MKRSNPEDRLSAALATWRVTPRRDPNFRPAVLARMNGGAAESWVGYVRAHVLGWSTAAALAVVAAGVTGQAVARARLDHSREQMVVSYLSELDPRVMAKLRP